MGTQDRLTDEFARSSIRYANTRIVQLEAELKELRSRVPRRPLFHGRCSLCGEPCNPRSRYCHACAWAEGDG